MLGGVDDIQPGSYGSDCAAVTKQRPPMGCAIYAERHAAHHAIAMLAQRLGKRFRSLFALGCGIAAADDGDGRAIKQLESALAIQEWRRVGDFQQAAGVVRISEGDEVVTRFFQPGQGGCNSCAVGPFADPVRDALGNEAAQLTARGLENRLR